MNELTDLHEHILSGNVSEALEFYQNMDFKPFYDSILFEAFEQPSICYYTFVLCLLSEDETVSLHSLATKLLIHPLCHMEGAYFSALYHVRRSLELTSYQSIEDLEMLLFLSEVPDQVVSIEEATDAAYKIIALDPTNQTTKEFMKKIKK
ncbi:hypothetical protein [Alkalicoccobacillus gibsonii]|uniref:hypothetical protein n=1 Tax=Alkalicoccobacillus gibsonii TaxID=79881 RepID=UPI0019329B22|nr:hypothetical protein [Alkalicoccobacillus gibsonii]MBM0064455.1 hypothetical protein [Alkalicoccobacillus gibsonii]